MYIVLINWLSPQNNKIHFKRPNFFHNMFTPLFTPSTKYAVQQKEKQPCKYLQSHYPIPQKIIHQSLHHSPIYMYIAQQYTRKKTQPIIWGREDHYTHKSTKSTKMIQLSNKLHATSPHLRGRGSWRGLSLNKKLHPIHDIQSLL